MSRFENQLLLEISFHGTTTPAASTTKQLKRTSGWEENHQHIFFLSLGSAGRKNLNDKFPYLVVATVALKEIKENCDQTFVKPRNRTLDRYKFFSRKQQSNESLRHFWNVLTAIASRCEFGEQTNSLIMDAFVQNMNNKSVQQRLCTEPKDEPEKALRFVVAFEERISQRKSFGGGSEVKTGRNNSQEEPKRQNCTRCQVAQ